MQSLCNKYEEVAEHIIDYEADFIFLSETWLSPNSGYIESYFKTINYNLYHKPRINQRGGGVGILASNKYKLNELDLGLYDSFEYCCYMFNHSNGKKFIFISLYRPPNNSLSYFFLQLTSIFEFITTYDAEIIIAGDINIHCEVLNNSSNQLFNLISLFNLKQHIH